MHKKRLSVSVLLLLLVEIVNKVFPLYIIHFVQKKLGVEGFGYAHFGISIIEMAVPFIVFGYHNFGSIELGRSNEDAEKTRKLISSIFILKLFHAALVFAFLSAVFTAIPAYHPYRSLVLILSFMLFFSSIDSLWVQVGVQKVAIFSFFNGASKLISFLLIIFTISTPDDAILYAAFTLMANVLICIFTGIYSFRKFPFLKPSRQDMWEVFKASRVYAAVVILTVVLERIDLVIVEKLFGVKGVGLYSGPLRLVHSVNQLIGVVILPFFSEMVSVQDSRSLANHTRASIVVLMAILAPSVAGIWFVDQQILELIFSPEYSSVNRVLSLLLLGITCSAMSLVFGFNILMLRDAQWKVIGSLIVGGSLSIVLAFVLGNIWGYEGVATAVVIGKATTAILTAIFALKFISYFPWQDFVKTIFAASLMAAGLHFIPSDNMLITILSGAVIYFFAIVIVYFKDLGHVAKYIKGRFF